MIPPSPISIFDPQVNGYAGVDFQADHPTPERLRIATQGWRRDGGDQFFLTLVTDHWPVLLNRLRQLRALVVGRPDLRDVIPGWHIEGPFLSDQPGFHGAHEPALMLDPTRDHLQQLRDAVGSDPLLLTLAPERRGAIEAIAEARRLGITISLGHTNASATQIREAVSAGATGFTHLGNACPQQLDRHDNILWRVADVPNLTIGLIADGLHVSPLLFRLLHRVVSPERIYYTTDAMSAAGAPPGDYPLGRLRLHVGPDRIVRQPGRSNFAGSALMPNELLPRASEMLGVPAHPLTGAVSATPRGWLGLPLLPRQAP
jgi:N-acetylglucosamine-6-phosphate deacetylase